MRPTSSNQNSPEDFPDIDRLFDQLASNDPAPGYSFEETLGKLAHHQLVAANVTAVVSKTGRSPGLMAVSLLLLLPLLLGIITLVGLNSNPPELSQTEATASMVLEQTEARQDDYLVVPVRVATPKTNRMTPTQAPNRAVAQLTDLKLNRLKEINQHVSPEQPGLQTNHYWKSPGNLS